LDLADDRVQQISDAAKLGELDLSPLGKAIHGLINASTSLDAETSADLAKLHKLLPVEHKHDKHAKMYWWKVCSAFGSKKCERKLKKHHGSQPKMPKKKIAEIKKVLQALRIGNKKRQAFEGGFISEEGIKVSTSLGSKLTGRSESGTSTRGLLRVCGSGTALRPSRR
jgi:hypothetical protein